MSIKQELVVKISENAFFKSLTGEGSSLQDRDAESTIVVVAVSGNIGDWAAYYENDYSGTFTVDIIDFGNKLPEDVARKLFPNWSGKYRE